MLRLLLQRGAVLLFRPAALLAEGFLLPEKNFLTFVLPATAMALTMSSVPVYIDFLGTPDRHPGKAQVNQDYLSGLFATILSAVAVLAFVLIVLGVDFIVSATIIAVFVIEKFADETTRFHEFHRRYNRWFAIQTARCLWLFIPIGLAIMGKKYEASFFSLSLIVAVGMAANFFLVTKLKIKFRLSGWRMIAQNSPFLGSSAIIASNRQIPRLAVAYLFPNFSHVFQAMSQISQGFSLLFNVRYIVPNRRIISRRTTQFEAALRPTFLKLSVVSLALSLLGCIIALAAPGFGSWMFLGALGVAMLADAIAFSLMSAYLGLTPWFVDPLDALGTFLIGGCVSILVFGMLYTGVAFLAGPLILIPVSSTVLSLTSVAIIVKRHLSRLPS